MATITASRGIAGAQVNLRSTKRSSGSEIILPMVQPSTPFLVGVTQFLKEHLPPERELLEYNPCSVSRVWKRITIECQFPYICPKQWRHSYATNGAENLVELYKGNILNLRDCCMHENVSTTEGYMQRKGDSLLKAFSK